MIFLIMIDYFFSETLFSVPADAFRGHGSSLLGTRTSHLRGLEARAVPAGVAASTSNNYILFDSCLINSLLIFEVEKILLSQPHFIPYSNFLNANVALCPPNPNELLIATRKFLFLASFGT